MTLSKSNAQLIINKFGKSYARNECALTIQCLDNNKTPFEVIQFTDGFVHLSTALNKTNPYQPIDICL